MYEIEVRGHTTDANRVAYIVELARNKLNLDVADIKKVVYVVDRLINFVVYHARVAQRQSVGVTYRGSGFRNSPRVPILRA